MLGQIKFPIGLKLVLIISGLLLTGMSVVIAMVWLLVSNDVEKTAIFNNDSTNAMSAGDAETVFASEISKTKAFLHIIANNASAEAVDSQTEYFFTQNNEIAAIISDENLINEQFFIDNEIDPSLVSTFVRQKAAADRTEKPAAEAVYVMNAAPVFNIPVLVLYFPVEGKETAVIFSAQVLSESFGNGAYLSFMTDEKLNLLIHSDFELIRDSKTIAGDSFAESFVKSGAESGKHRYFDTENREYFASARHIDDFNIVIWTRIPADVVFEGINTTTRRNMYLAAAVWFISVMFIYLFAKTISRPLKDLRSAAESIEDGHYKLDLKVYSQDETGILTAAVLSMSNVLENFEKFTNKELARLARKGTLETGGADKDATFFFSDIRSFTSISEKMSPPEVVEFLNDYMDRMVACVLTTGGVIDKFIGDAVMAHWGAVGGHKSIEANALAGVSAALMMRASLRSFNDGRGGDKMPIIRIGCGLNSGRVIAGQIGSDERLEFTVIGEAVSFADRCETFNKPFGTEIMISESTWRLVGKFFITEEMPSVKVKGKQVRMFAVVNVKDRRLCSKLLADLKKIPRTNPALSRKCVGPKGPKTLAELRRLLGIPTPDLSKVNTDEEEKKYKVKEKQQEKTKVKSN